MAIKFKKKRIEKRKHNKNEGVLKGNIISHFLRFSQNVNNIFRVISEKLQFKKII